MVKCPKCGEYNNRNDTYCGKCGAKLPEPKYCLFCNKSYIEKDFCTKCGTALISKIKYDELNNKSNNLMRNAQRNFDEKDFNLSIMYCDASIKIKPTEKAWLTKGLCFCNLKQYEEGIKCYEEAINMNSKSIQAYYWKAKTLMDLSKYDEAFDCFEIAHELEPHNVLPLIGKAHVSDIQKKYNAEIGYLKEILSIKPNNPTWWNQLGNAYLHINDFENGIECCDKAITLDPKYFFAWWTKGEIYFELKEYDKAMKNALEAKKIAPKNKELLDFIKKVEEAQNT